MKPLCKLCGVEVSAPFHSSIEGLVPVCRTCAQPAPEPSPPHFEVRGQRPGDITVNYLVVDLRNGTAPKREPARDWTAPPRIDARQVGRYGPFPETSR